MPTEIMREQPKSVKTGKDKLIICLLVTALLFLTSIAIFITMIINMKNPQYVPPKFDDTAIVGTPSPEESYLYQEIKTDYGFSCKLASNLFQQEDGSLYIYLTNPEENEVYMMTEIVDNETKKTIYKSGVIKPGEYLAKLKPVKEIDNNLLNVTIKIYAFETEHWYSEGTIEIECNIQPW